MRERAEVQTEIVIDSTSLVLSPAQDVAALRESIQRAVATAGTFVDFTTARGGQASVLVGPRSHVTLITERVSVDSDLAVMGRNDLASWDLL